MNHSPDLWMITAAGREYQLASHQALMPGNAPDIHDIAHALAQINRFNGHAVRPYSVAEHSLLVADIAARRGASATVQLAALLHDAHEAYVGDMHSPMKWALGVAWMAAEAPHIANVRTTFGIRTAHAAARAEIKHCDLIALATERRDITRFDASAHQPWGILDTPGFVVPPSQDHDLSHPWREAMSWQEWREMFLAQYQQLVGAIQAKTAKA